jgi:hypothetical protein
VNRHSGDLISDAVHRGLSGGIGIQDGPECWRLCQDLGAERPIRHEVSECLAKVLPEALVVQIKERLILHNRATQTGAELVQRERRQRRTVERRPGIELIIAQRVEGSAMILVGARLGNDVDLRTASGSAVGRVVRRADTKLLDRIECDVERAFATTYRLMV